MENQMGNRKSHTGKSRLQREYYTKAVSETEYNQTSDERLFFDNSDSAKIIEPEEEKIQKEPLRYKAKSIWEEHKFEIIISLITVICIPGFLFFAITLNRESGQHEKQLEAIESSVSEIRVDLKNEEEFVNQLRISNAEEAKDIEYLRNDINKIQDKIEKLEEKVSAGVAGGA